MPNAALVNFAAGETSPRSRGRFDLDWFRAACQKILNFIPEVPGPARFRSGFKIVRQTRGGAVARKIPFQLNSSKAYMLEFTPGKMRVYKDEDLLAKTPYDLLTTTALLDDFADGDYTANPVWTPYIAARVAVVANRLVCTAFDPGPGPVRGGAATTPQTRNIGTFQFDAEISNTGHVVFFATTYVPTVDGTGVTSYTVTGYGIDRTAAGNYKFGRFSGSGTFTLIRDLGVTGAGLKTFKFIRDSAGNWTSFVDGVLKGTNLDNTFTTTTLFAAQAHTFDTGTVTLDNIFRPGAGATDNQGVITAITQANPAVATVSVVGDLTNGDECLTSGIAGMLEMNGRQVKLANNAGLTFQLVDPVTGANIDSTAFGAYTSGGRLAEVYEIDTPYYAGDRADLSWAVSAREGVVYITHPKYDPRKLTVDSADNFVLATYARTNDPFTNRSATLTLTGLDRAATGTLIHFTPGSVIDPNATYTFSGIVGTTQLNGGSYRLRVPAGAFPAPRAFLVTTTGEAEVDSSTWTDYVSGGIAAPDVEHPIACAFYESRLGFFGTGVRPNSDFLSRAPDDNGNPRYDDFTGGTDADHAVFFALAPTNGQIDTIAWARGTAKYLFIGTFGGPFRVSGGGLDEPITPSSINVRQFDSFGCEAMTPAVASRVFWIQRGGVALRTARYDTDADDIRSYDMLLNAEQIAESRLQRVVLQAGRPDVLWVIREDGILAGMTVQGEENIAGWHRQKIGGVRAKVLDVQVLARTDKNDQLWITTERVVNGVTRRFVEILADDVVFPDPEDFYTNPDSAEQDQETYRNAVYRRQEEYVHLDAAGTFNGADRGIDAAATLTPAAVSGASVAFTASVAGTFTAADVGQQIWKKPHRDTGVGSGRATILSVNGPGTVATGSIDAEIPFDSTAAIAAGQWHIAATTIYGLADLDGERVAVVVDGAVYSDGRTAAYPVVTVALGKITLTDPAAVVHVGLPYEGFIKTHNLELSTGGGPAQAKPRNIVEAFIRFLSTLGVEFGTDIYDLKPIERRDIGNDTMDRPAPVFSGINKIHNPDNWQAEGEKHVIISQRLPLPCVVQFLDLRYETAEES